MANVTLRGATMTAKAATEAKVVERAVRVCRVRGLKFTPIRRRVLELLAASRAPVPAYTLVRQLATGKPVGPPTVYRALEFLIRAGFVRYIALHKAYICSELPDVNGPVALLMCADCGDVSEVASGALQDVIAQISSSHGFDPRSRFIEITGRCMECRSAA